MAHSGSVFGVSSAKSGSASGSGPQKTFVEIIGPGYWYDIHHMARRATTEETKYRFLDRMNYLRGEYPCNKCRPHIGEFMDVHPIRQFWNLRHGKTGEEIGMFKWSWMFHNAVNSRLGKPNVDFDTAYNLYGGTGSLVCTSGCDDEKSETSESESSRSESSKSESTRSESSKSESTRSDSSKSDVSIVYNGFSTKPVHVGRPNYAVPRGFRLIARNS